MPIYDFQCPNGHVFESIEDYRTDLVKCHKCSKMAKKIISASGQYLGNQDAAWLKTVHEVIEKRPHKLRNKPATREFLKNPTRANHKAWMKERGVVPLERGEENDRPTVREVSTDSLMKAYKKRQAISVRSR